VNLKSLLPARVRRALVFSLEKTLTFGIGKSCCPITNPLKLSWIAPKDPFAEAEQLKSRTLAAADSICTWEVDYIRLLLSHLNVEYTYIPDPLQLTLSHIVVYSRNQYSRSQIREGLKLAQPRLVFHLSDEWGLDAYWYPLLSRFQLVLRQHYFESYPSYSNIRTIPLGFMSGMLDGLEHKLDYENRPYVWSFIGTIKGERKSALDQFANLTPNYIGTAHPADMADIYKQSRFVVCPGGNINILFRNFEASVCGAIPVVAGCSRNKYDEATVPIGTPPWIFHEDWTDARTEVERLLEDRGALISRQKAVTDWWWSQIKRVQDEISSVMAK
jgi:hypothetical protein